MRFLLLLLLGVLPFIAGGCDTMPSKDPGYEVRGWPEWNIERRTPGAEHQTAEAAQAGTPRMASGSGPV